MGVASDGELCGVCSRREARPAGGPQPVTSTSPSPLTFSTKACSPIIPVQKRIGGNGGSTARPGAMTLGQSVHESEEQGPNLPREGGPILRTRWSRRRSMVCVPVRPDGSLGGARSRARSVSERGRSALQSQPQPLSEPHRASQVWSDSPGGTDQTSAVSLEVWTCRSPSTRVSSRSATCLSGK